MLLLLHCLVGPSLWRHCCFCLSLAVVVFCVVAFSAFLSPGGFQYLCCYCCTFLFHWLLLYLLRKTFMSVGCPLPLSHLLLFPFCIWFLLAYLSEFVSLGIAVAWFAFHARPAATLLFPARSHIFVYFLATFVLWHSSHIVGKRLVFLGWEVTDQSIFTIACGLFLCQVAASCADLVTYTSPSHPASSVVFASISCCPFDSHQAPPSFPCGVSLDCMSLKPGH